MPSAATKRFGLTQRPGNVRVIDVGDQVGALKQIVKMIEEGASDVNIRRTALIITQDCVQREDMCELQAIFNAVKNGDPRVPALAKGLKYMADTRTVDFFTSAKRQLAECNSDNGLCAEDCDGHTILVGALCASIGWQAGARAWGNKPGVKSYSHVYAGVMFPKRNGKKFVALDTTVPRFGVGDQPPRGEVLTAVID